MKQRLARLGIRLLEGAIRYLERMVPNPCPRGIDHTLEPYCISINRCIRARERGEKLDRTLKP